MYLNPSILIRAEQLSASKSVELIDWSMNMAYRLFRKRRFSLKEVVVSASFGATSKSNQLQATESPTLTFVCEVPNNTISFISVYQRIIKT